MSRRSILATALLAAVVAGSAAPAFADPEEEYGICVSTSSSPTGHGGDSICVNVEDLSGAVHYGW